MTINLGIHLMLDCDEENVSVFVKNKDQTISSIKIDDDRLHIAFEDGSKLTAVDNGQSCCEHRHMSCDDDLKAFVGAKLTGMETRQVENIDREGDGWTDEHEIEFLIVETSYGSFTIVNHNEHNGYYGGFIVVLQFEAQEVPS